MKALIASSRVDVSQSQRCSAVSSSLSSSGRLDQAVSMWVFMPFQSARFHMGTCRVGRAFICGLSLLSISTASWSDIPGITVHLVMRVSLFVERRSRVLSSLVGSLTVWVRAAASSMSRNASWLSLCLVLFFMLTVSWHQSISGRLKSPVSHICEAVWLLRRCNGVHHESKIVCVPDTRAVEYTNKEWFGTADFDLDPFHVNAFWF